MIAPVYAVIPSTVSQTVPETPVIYTQQTGSALNLLTNVVTYW